jgi:5-methylcytosine-specific restriction endonuclease McrA
MQDEGYRRSWRCHYCGCTLSSEPRSPNQKTIDHKKPRSRGGTRHPSNCVAACRRCNEEKANMTAVEYRKWLLSRACGLGFQEG